MVANKHFTMTGNLKPGRSAFDLSHDRKFTCDMGQLIPILAENCYPGDSFTIGAQVVVRMQPLVAPVLHDIDVFTHYFFVPNRLMMTVALGDDSEWFEFITGGYEGDADDELSDAACPLWTVTGAAMPDGINDNGIGSLWDYFGFPTGIIPTGAMPLDFPKRAYNMVWNWYYRDEFVQDEIDITTSEMILYRNWAKDYFTSAAIDTQLGLAPALPVSGTATAVWAGDLTLPLRMEGNNSYTISGDKGAGNPGLITDFKVTGDTTARADAALRSFVLKTDLDSNTIDLSSATTFDVQDLRLTLRIQEWMERNMRAGIRPDEYIQAHFGVRSKDYRIDKPEYIGGTKQKLIVSEVLNQADAGNDPVGEMSGHGISADSQYAGKYFVEEHGVIIGIMSVIPRADYQEGMERMWWKDTRYDWYVPEFANLTEQEIRQGELYASAVEADNDEIFGYQACWDEYKTRKNVICGQMRSTFDYWHMSRQFGAKVELTSDFLKCVPRDDCFAVPSEPQLIVQVGNMVKAIRPMPYIAIPSIV